MSYKDNLLPGLAVELIVRDGEYQAKYRTRIEDVGEKTLSVSALLGQGEMVPLREGTKVQLIFWDKVAAYALETKIVRRIAFPVAVFILELTDSVAKVQRRSYVRVPAIYAVTYETVTEEGLKVLHKASMLDLSGGGMQFLTEDRLENDELINVQVALTNGDLHTQARVSRAEKTDDGKRYIVSVEFDYITERDRDRVIRCVFDVQRMMRRKGLV